MTSPTITTATLADYLTAGEREYIAAIESNLSEDENLAGVRATFESRMAELYGADAMTVTRAQVIDLAMNDVWRRMESRAASRANTLLRDIYRGFLTFAEVDAALSEPLKVGRHRRTTLRNLTVRDIERLDEVKLENRNRVNKRYDEWEPERDWFSGLIAVHGNFVAAMSSDDMEFSSTSLADADEDPDD